MFEPFPLGLGGGRRSDRHGVAERHPTLALPRPFLDPRDIAAHGAVEEHGPHRVRRPEDDDRATRPSHPPLSYPRNRKRQLPLQEQLGESSQTRKGETSRLDEPLTPKPSSSRVSSRWKLRVKSQRKSTARGL